jgi:hypothetical protein
MLGTFDLVLHPSKYFFSRGCIGQEPSQQPKDINKTRVVHSTRKMLNIEGMILGHLTALKEPSD